MTRPSIRGFWATLSPIQQAEFAKDYPVPQEATAGATKSVVRHKAPAPKFPAVLDSVLEMYGRVPKKASARDRVHPWLRSRQELVRALNRYYYDVTLAAKASGLKRERILGAVRRHAPELLTKVSNCTPVLPENDGAEASVAIGGGR